MAQRYLAVLAALALFMLEAASPVHAQAQKNQAGNVGSMPSASAVAVDYAERFKTVCAACHGATGRSDIPGVPVIAGNSSLYAITQLFMFREGRRKNQAMVAMAKPMTDADLKGFSNFIGTLAAVPASAPASPPDAARMTKAKALAEQHKCTYCHGADLAGGQQVPRIGGQKEEYLSQTLHEYKSGDRPGYTRAMPEALSQVAVEDLDILAFYAANISSK